MARFTAAGTYTVEITGALLADAKFNTDPNAFDVCIEVRDPVSGAEGVWRGEFSNAYGKGKVSHMQQRTLTVQSLEKIGWTAGEDFSQLPTLVGMTIQVGVTEYTGDKGTFYIVRYLGGGSAEKPDAINNFAERMAALNGSQGGFQQQPANQAAPQGFQQPAQGFQQQAPENGFNQPAPQQQAPAQQAPMPMPMPGMPQQ